MRTAGTKRWAVGGVAFGLAAALSAGVAFAARSGAGGALAARVTSASASSGGAGASGYPGGGAMMGNGWAGNGAGGGAGGLMGGTNMMGGGGGSGYSMMGGGGSGGGSTVSAGGLLALVGRGEQGAHVDTKANSVAYTGRSVTLVALASPHGKPNMTWEIDGMVNPTVSVAPGAQVTVVLVNTDWGYMHGFELTTTPPPYPEMAMAGVTDTFFLMPLPPRTEKDTTTANYYTRRASFTAQAGTYHYLCPVPGHAAAGMTGTLVVS